MRKVKSLTSIRRFAVALAVICFVQPSTAENRDALAKIVIEGCVPHWISARDPAPCEEVDLSKGESRGVAILKDRIGVAQFLAIPTARISGVESQEFRGASAPNLFAAAWRARHMLESRLGRPLPRDAIGLAINAPARRSQDQAHVHVDCLRADVRSLLIERSPAITEDWSTQPLVIGGVPYDAKRIAETEFAGVNPFDMAALLLASRNQPIAQATIVVTGTGADNSEPGFLLLVNHIDPAYPSSGHGEDLLDHTCPIY